MLKVVILAMFTGVGFGGVLSVVKTGVDVEGVSMGLVTILTLAIMVTIAFVYEKKRIAKFN